MKRHKKGKGGTSLRWIIRHGRSTSLSASVLKGPERHEYPAVSLQEGKIPQQKLTILRARKRCRLHRPLNATSRPQRLG